MKPRWLQRNHLPLLTLVPALAVTLTALLMAMEFNLLEANLYDLRMSRGPQRAPSPDITLITLDNSTLRLLDEFSPLPLDYHAQLLEALESYGPRAVGYLVDMNRVHQASPDSFKGLAGTRFAESTRRLEERKIPVLLGTPFDVTGEVLPPYPLSTLPHAVALIHKDGNVFAEDKVTRRALVRLYGKSTFHVELARLMGHAPDGWSPRGSFLVTEAETEYFFIRYHGKTSATNKSYPMVSFSDVLDGRADPALLRDRILLVSTLTREDTGDYAFTPYSKAAYTHPKAIVHANILDSILRDDGIRRIPNWANWLITFALVTLVLLWAQTLKPLNSVFASLGLGIAFMITCQIAFTYGGLWIRESQPLVGIFVAYYLVVPYRLIRESKKRWDYQRKNEILMQVEELKRNFLSLVTHDLKTPVARIQGLTEVLLKKAAERLNDRDKVTVNHIIASTDELNRFISSILELTKIDSDKVQLNLESKDINSIIEKAAESFKAQARAKGIRIHSQLDPLFPFKFDVSLIAKVLNNLIDNALKYSPAGSEIWIESREIADHVEISVRDQGIGLTAEEKNMLFQRFYRAKNDTTTQVAGTGLGLYLTKFFLEAHHGSVEVQSTKGSGSTFKIRLPLVPPVEASRPGLRTRLQSLMTPKEKSHV